MSHSAVTLQGELESASAPSWLAVTFDNSFLASDFFADSVLKPTITAECLVNNGKRSDLYMSDMLDNISDIISYISKYVTLKIGDVVMLSDPNSKGTIINKGETITVSLNDKNIINLNIRE